MKIFALALLGPAMILDAANSSSWKIDDAAALAPGEGSAWDSQSITYPSVVRTHDRWLLIYQGTAIDEAGPHTAFGCAESNDGVAWKKLSDTPVFLPDTGSEQLAEAPNFTAWKSGFLMVYLVNPFLVHSERSLGEQERSGPEVRLAQSTDALRWRDLRLRHLPLGGEANADSASCIYADKGLLYLWWLAVANDKPVLCHSVSRDGFAWSKPSTQPTSEIDSRPISGARVYPSGDFYILSYVAYDDSKQQHFLVTKVSRDARSWARKGPPEFALPQPCVPFVVFTAAGARMYYDEHERTPDGRVSMYATLRSAFCAKASYENQ
jgi:predicted GH43/DUF377 family glycosyl hydrolase